MPHSYQWVWFVSLAGTVIYAWVRGGRTERAIATCLLTLSSGVTLLSVPGWRSLQFIPTLLDLCFLSCVFYAALRSDRWWPMAATAFQLIALLVRVAPVIDPSTRELAAYIGMSGWDYLTLAALVVGTALEGRRGSYRLLAMRMRA